MTKADQLARALDDFLGTSPDVEAAAVVSADGLPMASASDGPVLRHEAPPMRPPGPTPSAEAEPVSGW